MLQRYDDIRKRIRDEPLWFDCHGVPRYDEFHPSLSPNIYADEVLLFEIACQYCGDRFQVEKNWEERAAFFFGGMYRERESLADQVRGKTVCYGDPPCQRCGAGATMLSDAVRTVEFWARRRERGLEWTRCPELEDISLA